MSVEERYRSVPRIAAEAKNAGYTCLIHADIDMYFRRPLNNFIQIIRSHDVSIRFREGVPEQIRVLGAYMGFSLTEPTMAFLNSWAAQIDSLKPKDKPRAFGQTSFYRAYLEHLDSCRWGRLDSLPNSPKISKSRNPEADIWVGNSNRGRNRKNRTASIFAEDLKEMMRDPNSFVGSKSYRHFHYPSYSRERPTAGFEQTLKTIRQGWDKTLEGGRKIDHAPVLDIYFIFLATINELLQLNTCQSMIDLGSPNPFRYEREITLTDPESRRSFDGVQDYYGLKSLIQDAFSPDIQFQESADAVCVAGLLEYCSVQDIPWIIKEAFRCSNALCIFIIDMNTAKRGDLEWWEGIIEGIANDFPGINYHLFAVQADDEGKAVLSQSKRRKNE